MRFLKTQSRKGDTIVGLDLGSQQWKGVLIRRNAERLQLCEYVVTPCPAAPGKPESQAAAADTVQAMLSQLKTSMRSVVVAISSPSAWVAEIEIPRTPPEELRAVISLNSTRYLRRDLVGYYFEAAELAESGPNGKARRGATMRVLVAAALREEVLWYRNALSEAKVRAETIELSALTMINALQRTHAEVCEQNIVLLLDIGHQFTRLSFLSHGQPLLTRMMPYGGAQITEQVAATLGLQPAAAEQHKRAMTTQVMDAVRQSLQTLVREVRSSIDFVERQYDCALRYAFAGGGTACNRAILDMLGQDLGISVQQWNPVEGYDTKGLDPAELAGVAPCLGPAVGVAVAKL